MLKIAIVDDVKEDLAREKDAVLETLKEMDITCFSSLQDYLDTEGYYDLVLMDIRVGDAISNEYIRIIQRRAKYVLYVTEIEDMMDTSFHANVVGYHVKAKGIPALKNLLRKINEIYFHELADFCLDLEPMPVYLSNIKYIRQENRTKWLHKAIGSPVPLNRMNFSEILKEYPDVFIQISRDIIVNVSYIIGFSGNQIVLRNGEKLDVSRRRLLYVKQKENELNGWKR